MTNGQGACCEALLARMRVCLAARAGHGPSAHRIGESGMGVRGQGGGSM
jgi:hypothetical protein